MDMEETHIQECLALERQKLAIQVSATEVRMDDKIQASEKRIIQAVSGAIIEAVVELKAEIMRLEDKIDNRLN
jgi:hypothetical protein